MNCYVCGGPRGGKDRHYTCAESRCVNKWMAFRRDIRLVDEELMKQTRMYGKENPWRQWAIAHAPYEDIRRRHGIAEEAPLR